MNNTRFLSFFQWVLLAILALALSGCSNSESNTAEINIKIPASFLNQDNSGIAAQAVSGKPDNISRIIITVSGSKNQLYYSGDIVAAGGSLSLEVPPSVVLPMRAKHLNTKATPRCLRLNPARETASA